MHIDYLKRLNSQVSAAPAMVLDAITAGVMAMAAKDMHMSIDVDVDVVDVDMVLAYVAATYIPILK